MSGFEDEQERYRQRFADAERRLASYLARQGGKFALAEELAEKRRQLSEVEDSLAIDLDIPCEETKEAAWGKMAGPDYALNRRDRVSPHAAGSLSANSRAIALSH